MTDRRQRGAKAVTWNWSELQAYSDDVAIYALSERQAAMLQNVTARQATWLTRWYDRPVNLSDIKEFVGKVNNNLMQPLDICQLIADCIRDNPSTRDAIRELVIDEPSRDGNPDSVGGNGSSLNQELINNCNYDNFFAAVTGAVDLLNNIIVDIFERIELSTTALERTAIIIEAIPVIGQLPADEILEFADNELENLAQTYDSAYTVQLRDEYRCDLFCLYRDDCTLDFAQLAQYFAQRAQADFSSLTWGEAFNYFLTGTSQGESVSHAAHYLICLALAYGSRAIGFSAQSVASIVRALSNDSDSDWVFLCDCVELPCYTYDFSADNQGWVSSQGVYENAGYWRTGGNPNNNAAILDNFRVGLPVQRVLRRIEVDYEVTSRGQGATFIRWINHDGGGIIDGEEPVQGGVQTYISDSTNINATVLELRVRAGDRFSTPSNQIRVYEVRVYCSD